MVARDAAGAVVDARVPGCHEALVILVLVLVVVVVVQDAAPGHSLAPDVHDARRRNAVRQRQPSGMPVTSGRPLWQQRNRYADLT
ncbi:hypothetical protein [Streptomyces canus]|uniref:hypothetical protein n=1 Tax=Streptomyces canus TaxID=58343 RepID=UPI00131A3EFB